MQVRVGLMGFGRIGRNIFRILHKRDDIQVCAISDPADHKNLEYLLKYDTIMGRFPDAVRVSEGSLFAAGRQIKMLSGREPGELPWGDLGVDVVIEATGRERSTAEVRKHLESGAKRVVMCVPATDDPDLTVIYGVNHQKLTSAHRIVSAGSVTANCIAPIAQILYKAFGVERLFLTTVHAYTNALRLADVPASDLRRSRAAAENIIPTDTNAGKVLSHLLPQLEGKVSALALNVPVPNGSVVDMVTYTKKAVSAHAVNEVVRTAVAAYYPSIVEYAEDPIVSSDVKGSPYSCTFDSLATMTLGEQAVKTITWYDNGWGYAHRVVDIVQYMAKLPGGLA